MTEQTSPEPHPELGRWIGLCPGCALPLYEKQGWKVGIDGPQHKSCWLPHEEAVKVNRDYFLSEAGRLINGDRQKDYGDAIDDFTRTGKMWAAILGLDEVSAEQVAMCMAAVKIGRLCTTPNHTDSWTDAIGYLALGGDISHRPGRYI